MTHRRDKVNNPSMLSKEPGNKRHRLFGASPNFARSEATNALSSLLQIMSFVTSSGEKAEETTSRCSTVSTRSLGVGLSNLAKSVLLSPSSQPRGVRCHSVHSLLAVIEVLLSKEKRSKHPHRNVQVDPAPQPKEAGSLLLKEASLPTTSRLSQLEARTSWTASGEPSTTLAQDDKGEER